MRPFNLETAVAHNGSKLVVTPEGLVVTTPESQWAYAAELPRSSAVVIAGEGSVTVTVNGVTGAVGIALIGSDQSRFIVELQVASNETIELTAPNLTDVKSIIVRNTSNRGPSIATIKSIEVGRLATQSITPTIIDASPFAQFGEWEGRVPAGYFTDWSGALTRFDVCDFDQDHMARYSKERVERHGIQSSTTALMDWVPLVESLTESTDVFRMAALGAGWGRWASAGAFLAKRIGRDYRILAVEAEPQHFAWLERHMFENGLADERTILVHAAAAGQAGFCWFQTGNSAVHYGQSIQSFGDEPNGDVQQVRVEAITLEQVLEYLSPLDYLHMDIQGDEFELLSAFPAALDSKIKCVNIGTHSAEIEVALRLLFNGLGWTNRYDIHLGSTQILSVDGTKKRMTFEDGVQVWRNPKL